MDNLSPDDALRKIKYDIETGGPLSELLKQHEESTRSRHITNLVAQGILDPEFRNRGLSDLIQETTLILSDDILAADNREKYQNLIKLYSHFRDKVPGVVTYNDLLKYVAEGKVDSRTISLWIAEEIITGDKLLVEAVKQASYSISPEAQIVLEGLTSKSYLVASQLRETIDLVRKHLLPEVTLSAEGLTQALKVTRTLPVCVREIDSNSASAFQQLLIAWATEFPSETSISAEQYRGNTTSIYQGTLRNHLREGGRFFGAFNCGELVGMIRLDPSYAFQTSINDSFGTPTTHVQSLYVADTARNAGIEAELLGAAQDYVSREGKSKQILALVSGSKTRWKKLYEAAGFRLEGIYLQAGLFSEMYIAPVGRQI